MAFPCFLTCAGTCAVYIYIYIYIYIYGVWTPLLLTAWGVHQNVRLPSKNRWPYIYIYIHTRFDEESKLQVKNKEVLEPGGTGKKNLCKNI